MQTYVSVSMATVTIVITLLFSFSSCKKIDVQDLAPSSGTANNAALQQAVANSFDLPLEKVVYNKEKKQFVVDGDGIVSLEDANARFSSPASGKIGAANEAAQRKYSYVVSASKVNVIKIYADTTLPLDWLIAIDSGIVNWNASGSNVNMERILTSTGASTIISSFYDTTTSVIATAGYPTYFGAPGRSLAINTYYNSLDTGRKIFAITHELGHTIGLCHTNENTGSLISGTPKSDANSVMNSVCKSWEGFSNYDLKAVNTLYPKQ